MDFEWDEAKARSNLAKHGIDFEDAARVFLDPRLRQAEDLRRNYGERRWIAVGMVDESMMSVVFTWRGGACRIISARRATRAERREYGQDSSV
jgi:uncharacterized DUF497 family protein